MSNESIFINEQTIEEIKENCSSIKDSTLRCKTAARVFASNIAKMFFENDELDCESGIHNIPEVISDIEISDVYLRNCFIDVRFYFNSNELCVPASLFKRNLLPVAFMFIKLSEDLSGAEITGYITPSEIVKSQEIDGYYPVEETSLLSFYDIESLLNADEGYDVSQDDFAEIFDFLDNKLDDTDVFYRKLFESKALRLELIKAASANRKFKIISDKLKDTLAAFSDNEETVDPATEYSLEPSDNIQEVLPLDSGDDVSDFELQEIEGDIEDLAGEAETLEEFDVDSALDEIETDDITNLEEFSDSAENLDIDEEQNTESSDFEQEISSYEEPLTLSDFNNTSDLTNTTFENIDYDNEQENEVLYSTETTPSLKMYEENENNSESENKNEIDTEEEQKEIETAEESEPLSNLIEDVEPEDTINTNDTESEEEKFDNSDEESESADNSYKSEPYDEVEEEESNDIDALFSDNSDISQPKNETYDKYEDDASDVDDAYIQQKPKKSVIPIIGLIVLLAGLGYIGFSKFVHPNTAQQNVQNLTDVDTESQKNNEEDSVQKEQPDAMPTETVENIAPDKTKNEGTAVSIPAIEQNLDASVLVSNLSISWEVPAAYTTNNSARRYFAKIGKIIQINLKAEMLLLNKPPINNKIVLELEYNKTSGNYSIKGFSVSSGEKTIDDIIVNTVKNVLNMNLNIDTSSFGNIQGNPMLIIKL